MVSQHSVEVHAPPARLSSLSVKSLLNTSLHKSNLQARSLTLPGSVCRLILLLPPARKQRDASCHLQTCSWLARASLAAWTRYPQNSQPAQPFPHCHPCDPAPSQEEMVRMMHVPSRKGGAIWRIKERSLICYPAQRG